MEIALAPEVPTYSGGLGILAGDTLRSAADLSVPMVAVSLAHRKGYFTQQLDAAGAQSESAAAWEPAELLPELEPRVSVEIEDRKVLIRAWRFDVRGLLGHVIPVYLLDTDVEGNSEFDRTITDRLYGGDSHYRLCQELVLGMGGARMLRALGHLTIEKYHMNEGHSALLALELLEEEIDGRPLDSVTAADMDKVRTRCVFTTHTPVPAGHDRFEGDLVRRVLGEERSSALRQGGCYEDGSLNMTYLALRGSSYINGVAMLHGEVSQGMFPAFPISAITNGVHATTWTAPPLAELYDRHIPEWRRDNVYLRYALGIPVTEIRAAHRAAKRNLLAKVNERGGAEFSPDVFTIGFARRAATYKRADLIFSNPERVRWIAENVGPFQVIYGGKAHPADDGGKQMIERVFRAAEALKDAVKVIYVEDYDWEWGQLLTSGVDLWLNTPRRPQEASGTSGMKAALNGVPSLSILDGWWVEGCLEGVTGWSIGHGGQIEENAAAEAASLYDKLETGILPLFYGSRTGYGEVMRSAVAVNGSFFNTRRMVSQYVINAYFPGAPIDVRLAD